MKCKIPKGWSTYKLSELIDLIGGGTPKTSVPEYWSGNIPWLSVVDFGNGSKHVYKTEKNITEKGLLESSTKILKKGSLIISARGTVGELAVLGLDMAFNQSCYGINSKDKTINDYIYYLIKHNVSQIRRKTHGAVFDTITRLTFDNIDVLIPTNLAEQHRIATILSSLDDKIELNLQMNKTLEAIAQAIFKEWFVNFRFPGFDCELVDGLPKEWRIGNLGDLISISKDSLNPSSFPNKVFSHYSIPAFDDGKSPINELGRAILSNKFIVKKNSILLSKLNPRFPRLWLIRDIEEETSVTSTEFIVLQPHKKYFYSFIYSFLNLDTTINKLAGLVTGTSSSHQRIRPIDIINLPLIIPNDIVLEEYEKIVGVMHEESIT